MLNPDNTCNAVWCSAYEEGEPCCESQGFGVGFVTGILAEGFVTGSNEEIAGYLAQMAEASSSKDDSCQFESDSSYGSPQG